MTDEERNAYDNLILMCPNHHKLIDRLEPERFTVPILQDMKQRAEGRTSATEVGAREGWATEVQLNLYAHQAIEHTIRTGQIFSNESGSSVVEGEGGTAIDIGVGGGTLVNATAHDPTVETTQNEPVQHTVEETSQPTPTARFEFNASMPSPPDETTIKTEGGPTGPTGPRPVSSGHRGANGPTGPHDSAVAVDTVTGPTGPNRGQSNEYRFDDSVSGPGRATDSLHLSDSASGLRIPGSVTDSLRLDDSVSSSVRERMAETLGIDEDRSRDGEYSEFTAPGTRPTKEDLEQSRYMEDQIRKDD